MNAVQLAAHVTKEYRTRNPFKICDMSGIVVVRHPLVEFRGYYRRSNGVSVIVLAEGLPGHVEHFVCAHELGHKLQHESLNRIFMDSRTFMETGRYENSADRFACHLLYSGPPLFQEETITALEMAECLDVPECNVNARLIELGIHY